MTVKKQNKNNKRITNKRIIAVAFVIFCLEQLFQIFIQTAPQMTPMDITIQLAYLVFTVYIVININQFSTKIDQQADLQKEPSWLLSLGRAVWIVPLVYIVNVAFQGILILIMRHYPHHVAVSANQNAIYRSFQSNHWLFLLTSFVTIVIISPWCEEFLFRIALINQPSFSKTKWIYVLRIIFSIIIFAYMHMLVQSNQLFHQGPQHELAWVQFCAYLSISCVLTYMYVRYHSYRTNILAHMIWNCLTVIQML